MSPLRRFINTRLAWLGWTQADLAMIIGISESTISRELRFERPRPELVHKIAEATDLTVEILHGQGCSFCSLISEHQLERVDGVVPVETARAWFLARTS